jgi:predicted acylesterase/phospholipase RssA
MTSLEGVLSATKAKPAEKAVVAGKVVLVMQGGGAQAAYEGGVYEALHEAGIEPDWVIGTSIGAINGSIIAGNEVKSRLKRLREFWSRIESRPRADVWTCGEPAHDPADWRARFLFTQHGLFVGSSSSRRRRARCLVFRRSAAETAAGAG